MKFTEEYEITSHEVDRNNNIRPTALIRYMNETADHQMRDRKPTYQELFMDGKAFIVTRMNIKIYKKLSQYNPIKVNTWICSGKAATFPRAFEIFSDEDLAVEAHSEWAVVNRDNGKLCKTTEIDISNYEKGEAVQLELPKRFHFPKDVQWRKVGERKIFLSDCDMNMHMNNGNYANLLWNYIPGIENKQLTSLNVRFMHEAALGNTVEIFITELDREFAKDGDAEEVYGFLTKVNGETNVEYVMGVKNVE